MREWGAEGVTSLVRSALTHDHNPPLKQDLVSHVLSTHSMAASSGLSGLYAYSLCIGCKEGSAPGTQDSTSRTARSCA